MIITLECTFNEPLPIKLAERFGPKVEAEALEFLNEWPIEWRLGDAPYRPGKHRGHPNLNTFHDLQRPIRGGTRGTPIADTILETRGIGECKVMLWLREGTFPQSGQCG